MPDPLGGCCQSPTSNSQYLQTSLQPLFNSQPSINLQSSMFAPSFKSPFVFDSKSQQQSFTRVDGNCANGGCSGTGTNNINNQRADENVGKLDRLAGALSFANGEWKIDENSKKDLRQLVIDMKKNPEKYADLKSDSSLQSTDGNKIKEFSSKLDALMNAVNSGKVSPEQVGILSKAISKRYSEIESKNNNDANSISQKDFDLLASALKLNDDGTWTVNGDSKHLASGVAARLDNKGEYAPPGGIHTLLNGVGNGKLDRVDGAKLQEAILSELASKTINDKEIAVDKKIGCGTGTSNPSCGTARDNNSLSLPFADNTQQNFDKMMKQFVQMLVNLLSFIGINMQTQNQQSANRSSFF